MKKACFSFIILVFSNTIHCQEISSSNFFLGVSDVTEFFNYFNHQDVIANPVLGIAINQDVSVIAQFEESTIFINDEIDDVMICHLGIRFNIYSDYYAQFNFHDFFSDSNYEYDNSISVGAFYHLDWVNNMYLDPSISVSQGSTDIPDFNFNVGLGLFF